MGSPETMPQMPASETGGDGKVTDTHVTKIIEQVKAKSPDLSPDDLTTLESSLKTAKEMHPDDPAAFAREAGTINLGGRHSKKVKTAVRVVAAAVFGLGLAGGAAGAISAETRGAAEQKQKHATEQTTPDSITSDQAAADEQYTMDYKPGLTGGDGPEPPEVETPAPDLTAEATIEGTADMYRGVVIDTMGLQGQELTDQQKAEVLNAAANLAVATLTPEDQGSFSSDDLGVIEAEDIVKAVQIDKDSNTVKIIDLEKIKTFAKALFNAAGRNLDRGTFHWSNADIKNPDGSYDFKKLGIDNIDWGRYGVK